MNCDEKLDRIILSLVFYHVPGTYVYIEYRSFKSIRFQKNNISI